MFDHYNRIAICRESAQDFRQLVHICKMKSGCRFVQNVHCLPSASPAQFSCKLDPLCFTAGKGCRRLAKTNIRKSYIVKCLHFSTDTRYIFKEMKRLFYRHIQNIINAFSFIFYLQCLTVVAFSAAYLTRHIYIRKEMHLNLDDSISATRFTASALDVKAESSFFIAFRLRIRGCRKQLPDQVEYSGICRRIGSWRPSDWRLVNVDHFVQHFQSFNPLMLSRNHTGTV